MGLEYEMVKSKGEGRGRAFEGTMVPAILRKPSPTVIPQLVFNGQSH